MDEAARWARVSAILSAALDRPEAQRARFLAESVQREPALRTEILAMSEELRSASESGFLERPPLAAPRAPARFGPYRVVGELGAGGMGVVYLADRDDGQFVRRVAVKRVGRGAPGVDAQRRFEGERRILAGLDHPNIARLLDAGVDGDGVSYLVMEHVEGVPITRYCDEGDLGVRQRLALFLSVCAAVRYAHQNLVVHRDIKPANILVGADGVPKLLDFGIAKLLEPDRGGEATDTVNRAVTLDYASPEQLLGKPINTTSDVYSLGVVLYQLLARRKPYECDVQALSEAVRSVCQEVPALPSRVASRRLRQVLEGDLDAIVAKALEKSPADRYVSVEDLADDVAGYLEHRPVRARRASRLYLLGRFARRHRGGVAIATLGLIGLVAGTAAIAWQARVAERERLRAERRFEDVRKLAGWVIYELHDAIANLPGATPARRLLVARALEYLDSLALEVGDDDALQRELADAYRRLAWVQGGGAGANLGDSTDAFESHAKAMAIRGRLAARSPADAQDEVGLALLEYDLGTLQRTVGQVAEAELSFQSAASRLEAVDRPGVMPGSAPGRLGAVYQRLAEAQAMQGKRDAARRSAERAVAEAEEALSAQPDDSALQTVAAASLNQLAAELAFGGELPAALEQLGRARGAIQASPGEPVRDARQVRILLFILNAESRFRARLGDAKGANEVAEDALGTAEDSLGRDPSDRWSQMAVVAAASQLGRCLTDSGDAPGAVPRFRRALAIAERAISEDPDYEVARREAASARYGLGRALLAQGAPSLEPEACDVLRRAEALWSQRQSEGRLPSADAADLERIPGLLELCPIGS